MLTINNGTGSAWHTSVLTEDGADLAEQFAFDKIDITIPMGANFVKATMHLAMLRVGVRAELAQWLTRNPVTGQEERLASMTFASGTAVEFKDNGEVALHVATNS